MNTILGLFLVIVNGEINSAVAVDSYSSLNACHEDLHKRAQKIELSEGQMLYTSCVNFAVNLAEASGDKVET